ncbi:MULTISPECIES: hypothetical protein [Halobacillus]|uniref:hypothetical protein n=1 Tax=Halobacillus TaxID=45667 RepID=UPI0009A7977A|nr:MULTISPECIES: hypothetical protein [Halobacillus]
MEEPQEKVFIFPEEVESDYNIITGISLKNFVTKVLPFALIGVGIVLIPPYPLWLLIIRGVIGLIVGSIGFALVLMKPIRERMNITLLQWLKYQQDYKNRQKLFYTKTKPRNHFLE